MVNKLYLSDFRDVIGRDVIDRVYTRVMLTLEYLSELCTDELVQIRQGRI